MGIFEDIDRETAALNPGTTGLPITKEWLKELSQIVQEHSAPLSGPDVGMVDTGKGRFLVYQRLALDFLQPPQPPMPSLGLATQLLFGNPVIQPVPMQGLRTTMSIIDEMEKLESDGTPELVELFQECAQTERRAYLKMKDRQCKHQNTYKKRNRKR